MKVHALRDRGKICFVMAKWVIGLLSFVLWTAGCWQKESDPFQATIALVNDAPITVADLLAVIPGHEKDPADASDPVHDEQVALSRALLDQLIEEKLLLQEAERLNIQLRPTEISDKISGIRDGMDDETFSIFLRDQQISREDLEAAMEKDLLIEKLLKRLIIEKPDESTSVTEESVRRYYEARKEDWWVEEELKLRQIVVDTPEEAESLHLSILNGADFLENARRYSKPSHNVEEGDLGYLQREATPLEFDPLYQMEIGEISQVIKTSFGYHIVRVEDRRPARIRSYEEVREQIYQKLLDQKRDAVFNDWMSKLRQRSEIRINEELLDKYL